MKKFSKNISGFTLIELLVSMTIFSIIMISVIQVYVNTTQTGTKTELTRAMQENLKSISENIAEDVRKGRIGAYEKATDFSISCSRDKQKFIETSKLKGIKQICVGDEDSQDNSQIQNGFNTYGLGKKTTSGGADSFNFDNSDCGEVNSGAYTQCYLLKQIGNGKPFPISNNLVNIKDLNFTVFPGSTSYVTMNFTIEPTKKGGVSAAMIQDTKIDFQTTFSERFVPIK